MGGGDTQNIKGKLAHHFMTSYLVSISCLLEWVKTLREENNENVNTI